MNVLKKARYDRKYGKPALFVSRILGYSCKTPSFGLEFVLIWFEACPDRETRSFQMVIF